MFIDAVGKTIVPSSHRYWEDLRWNELFIKCLAHGKRMLIETTYSKNEDMLDNQIFNFFN